MQVTFWGATREVTGSMHLITHGDDQVVLDCGMFQGRRKESEAKNRNFPLTPEKITNLVLSHAHIDHSGRIPLLMPQGFSGRILCTRATADASHYLLLDSAKIQESDAQYLNYKAMRAYLQQNRNHWQGAGKDAPADIRQILKKGRHELNDDLINDLIAKHQIPAVRPLYSTLDAEAALSRFDGYPYRHPVTVAHNMALTFYEAGHILGSAMSVVRLEEHGQRRVIAFTGDIGRYGRPIIRNPAENFEAADQAVDLLIMESTYGDRTHGPVAGLKNQMEAVLNETHARGGSVLIPSFAFGRTQEIIYTLHELYNAGRVPRLPVYVDSPLAINLTKVYGEHPENYDQETHRTFLMNHENPFAFQQIQYISSVEASMALMREERPHIVIASSGMCEAGRILHHLRNKIHNPRHTILIVGYMAANTLGRRILEQGEAREKSGRGASAPIVRILGKEYPLKARVVKLDGFSAHADKDELLAFLEHANLKIKKIAVVHGEEDQSLAFAGHLKDAGYDAFVPRTGDTAPV